MTTAQPNGLQLDEPDQRLLALARERIPLAEVAVRLGVPIGEADRRIALLCAKLGYPDRAALQLSDDAPKTPALMARDAEGASAVPRKHVSRRRLLGTAVAGSIAVVGAGTWMLRWSGGPGTTRRDAGPQAVETAGTGIVAQTSPQSPPSAVANSGEMISGFGSGGIAFIRDGDLWVYDVYSQTGARETQITRGGKLSHPQWSPSGRFLSARGSGRLWVFSGARSHSWDSFNLSGQLSVAAWHPERDELDYVSPENVVVRLNYGSQPVAPHTLVAAVRERTISSVSWRSDGDLLTYSFTNSDPGKRSTGFNFVRADGSQMSGQEFVMGPTGDTKFAGWVGTTHYLYWHAPVVSASIWADGVPLFEGPEQLIVPWMLANSTTVAARPGHPDEVALVTGGGREEWTGKRIALAKLPAEPVELANAASGSLGQPAWSADGTWLAYVRGPDTKELTNDAASNGLGVRRVYIQDVSLGGPPQVLADDPGYRDEHPTWLAAGSVLFARIDSQGDASLWLWDGVKTGRLSKLITGLRPPGVYGSAGWFGYYGHVDWDAIFSVWKSVR